MVDLDFLFSKLKGSSSSGNFGHAGRPGKKGGSGAGGGHGAIGIEPADNLKSKLQDYRKSKKKPIKDSSGKDISEELSSGTYIPDKIDPGQISLGGVNESYKVHIENDGDAIIKPDKPGDSSSKNEVAAFAMSEALGFDNVPATVRREGGTYTRPDGSIVKENASAQQWKSDAKVAVETRGADWEKASERSYSRMVLMDGIMNNDDRHGGNYMLGKKGKITAIDNGRGFNSMYTDSFHYSPFIDGIETWGKLGNETLKFNAKDIDAVAALPKNKAFQKSFVADFGEDKYKALVYQTKFIAENKNALVNGVDVEEGF